MIIRIAARLASAALFFSLLAPVSALAKGVVLNFSDVDIATMVKFISDLTGKNFVMDERVKGKISVYSPSKLSSDEAFSVFTSVLELKGFTVVPAGKVYKIIPTAQAKQSGMRLLTEKDRVPVSDAYVARIIPLERISAQDAVTFLQPIVSKDGYIAAFGSNNMLMVVDSALNIQKLTSILAKIDSSQRREGAETIFLKNATADSVATVIREWLGGKGGRPATPGQAGQQVTSAAGVLVIPDSRLNALVVSGSDRDKEDIKQLVALIDVVPPTTSSKINVYYLENADATEVGKVLDGIIKGAPVPGQPGGAAAAPVQSPFEGGKISVTPDKATNSLVIMASPADYQNLLQVIQKLDKRRRQVFVQAVIAEVAIDRLSQLGLEATLSGGGITGNTGAAGIFDPFSIAAGSTPQSQLLFTVLKGFATGTNVQVGGVLKAMFDDGSINVLSTPTILTSDNKEAEIFVGENVPFLTQTNLTTGGVSQQSVERKDTGITLRITPQISEGEFVKLDIYQEISDVKQDKGQATDLVTRKRSAKTAVVVKDMETVVIGGLIQDRDLDNIRKVPLLGDIPLLGWLFKSKTTQRQKINLMIVLTPRIIRGAQEMTEVYEDQKGKFVENLERDEPFSLQQELKLAP
ncbi:type II secretion system secretin GspD [Geobacter sp.]|uniref:type II secretion system secretin GspD n=1 Tax=Geobacter sp. TaxID=46610 RepID=UPI0027B9BF94|nr:type II secretion system secretin GspD [Geobacter sp.]